MYIACSTLYWHVQCVYSILLFPANKANAHAQLALALCVYSILLFPANKANAHAQLALALAWNRDDIARADIFTAANREHWKVRNIPE
jgi:hypothetical protein